MKNQCFSEAFIQDKKRRIRPWLLLPPQWAHDLSPLALPLLGLLYDQKTPEWNSFTWRNLHFKNPLGIAGGLDKNAENLNSWWAFGSGFVEVGTVTPLPQDPNPGKIMDRDMALQALWNKMGFPSAGAQETFYNLLSYQPNIPTPVFVNIGKNRITPNEDAVTDYLSVMNTMKSVADAFVVNISSPNTKGLRDLQSSENLKNLLGPLIEQSKQDSRIPLLVKLSPDMPEDLLATTIQTCHELGSDGYVLTNTTLSRPSGCQFPAEGGLSGAPLQDLSKRALKIAVQTLGTNRRDKLLVSVGGILSPDDVYERLQMGADLVQIYTALIFHGPRFFHDVARRTNDRR